MSTYSAATIKRSQTILRNAGISSTTTTTDAVIARSQNRAPRKPRKTAEQIKQDQRWAAMSGKLATYGQMNRINDCYDAEGLRTFATLASFRRVFDMESASREWCKLTGRYAG